MKRTAFFLLAALAGCVTASVPQSTTVAPGREAAKAAYVDSLPYRTTEEQGFADGCQQFGTPIDPQVGQAPPPNQAYAEAFERGYHRCRRLFGK